MVNTNTTQTAKELAGNCESAEITQSTYKTKFELTSYKQLMTEPLKPLEWVLEGFIPKVGVSLLTGDGGIGKSWVALYLAQCVASGTNFLGIYPVTQGKVLIIDEENHKTVIRSRCEKLHLGTSTTNRDLEISFLENKGIYIDNNNDFVGLSKAIKEFGPSLVIIDALVRVHTKDENSAMEMRDVFRRAKRIADECNTSVLFTHHTPRAYQGRASSSVRGSTDIRNAVDSVLFVYKAGQHKAIKHDKSRYGNEVEPFGFEIIDRNGGVGLELTDIRQSYQRESKWAEAEKVIFSLLKKYGKVSRYQFLEAGNNNHPRISVTTMDKNLLRLEKAGRLSSEGGDGGTKYYFEKREP
jgi:predicted ATP-dependent serine protease